MKKPAFLFAVVCLFVSFSSLLRANWGPYNYFQVGTKGMGVGGAFTSLADDLGAFYANPAGLIHVERPALSYQLYSSIRVQRLIDTTMKLDWEYFPLVGFAMPVHERMSAGFFVQTLFKSPSGTYSIHGIGLSYSVQIIQNFALGISAGTAVGHEQGNWAAGWFVQAGCMALLSDTWRFGAVVKFPFSLNWDQLRGDVEVQERLPWSLQAGFSWRISDISIASFELEYQGWNAIRYISRDIDLSPELETGLFKSWHPHAGFQFLHDPSGAQVRFGIMTMAAASSTELEVQPVLTLGIGAFTSDFFKLDFALLDTVVFDIFTRTDRFEQFLLSFEYTF